MRDASQTQPEILTIRGLACVFLVAYHVIGYSSATGLRLPMNSSWHHLTASFDFLRMPLFSALSGYLYAMRRPDHAGLRIFWRKKARRLLIPLLFATSVTIILRQLAYGDATPAAQAYLFHYQHFWFLQALLLIFALVSLWDSVRSPSWVGLAGAAFLAMMVTRSIPVTEFLSLNGAIYLAPFFMFGMIARSEPVLLDRPEPEILALWILAIVVLFQQVGMLSTAAPLERSSVPASLCGLAVSLVLFARMPRVAILERIGRYSYTIYIWHSIAGAAVRTAIGRAATLPVAPLFLILLACGLSLPILLHRLVARAPVLAVLFLGLSPKGPRTDPGSVSSGQAVGTARSGLA